MAPTSVIAGVFVGGASSRMGMPKGLLRPPDGSAATLVDRLVAVLEATSGVDSVVLVGRRAEYEHFPYVVLPDAVPEVGPLGGLLALMEHAEGRGIGRVIAVGCDLPHLTSALVRRLLEHSGGPIVAPRAGGYFQPLCARYDCALSVDVRAALRAGRKAVMPLLRAHRAVALDLGEKERIQVEDWDTPDDTRGVKN